MSRIDDICDMGYEDSIVFRNPEYEDAIIGVTIDGNVLYDYDKCAEYLVKHDNMSIEEAIEYVDYNMTSIGYGHHPAPLLFTRFYDYMTDEEFEDHLENEHEDIYKIITDLLEYSRTEQSCYEELLELSGKKLLELARHVHELGGDL